MKKIIFTLLYILQLYLISAANDKVLFTTLSVNDGLSHSDVNTIVQDFDGFMWFGTYNGLCRYDGKSMVTYRTDNSGLSNNRILSLSVGNDSLLYIGTEGGGVNVYQAKYNRIIPINRKLKNKLSLDNEIVNSIFKDVNNEIWLCSNIGMSRVSRNVNDIQLENFRNGNLNENILSADQLDNDNLLLGTNLGLRVFSKKDLSYKKLLGENFKQHVNIIKKFRDNSFLIGTTEALYLFNPQSGEIKKKLPQGVLSIFIDNMKNVWVGTSNDGLLLFDYNFNFVRSFKTDISKQNSLSGNVIRTLYIDESGVLWIGTINEGVSKTNISDKKIELYSLEHWKDRSLIQTQVITFFEDNNNILWIGTRGDGLSVMDLKSRKMKKVSVIGNILLKDVSSFYQDINGTIWIGSWQGLYRVSKLQASNIWDEPKITPEEVNKELSYSNISIFKIVSDKDNHLWISTSRGVYHYVPGTKNYYQGLYNKYKHNSQDIHSIQDDFVTNLLVDHNGKHKTIWVGTRSGLSKIFFKNSRSFTERITFPQSKGEFVSIIHRDKSNDLWVATLGGGLHKLVCEDDKAPLKIITYNLKTHGFPNNELESMLEDNHGNFWIGGKGIFKFNPSTGDVKYFSGKDKLQYNSFKTLSNLKLRSGEMVFGGGNGFNIFNPDSVYDSPIKPKVLLTGLKIFSKEIGIRDVVDNKVIFSKNIFKTDRIELSYENNSLTFEFTALHFIAPAYNKYKFKLEGFDKDWRYTAGHENFGVYTNLKHGEYKFIVYGGNSDGVWNEVPAVLSLIITPPFWLTGWAYLFYFILILFLLYIFRVSALKKLESQHILQMEKKLREEEQKTYLNKIKFYTDISHEIKTPLALISVPIDDLLTNIHIGNATRSKLSLVSRNVKNLMNLVEQILDFRKFESNMMNLNIREVNIRDFIQDIAILFKPLSDSKRINLNLAFENQEDIIYLDPEKMEKVIMNLISNALKFSPNNINIDIYCRDTTTDLCISIHDYGIGINENELNKIFEPFYQSDNNTILGGSGIGLSLAKYIVDLHLGKIWVESNNKGGASFFVSLLKGYQHFKENVNIIRDNDRSGKVPKRPYFDERSEVYQFDKKNHIDIGKLATIIVVEDNADFRNYIEEILLPKYNVITIEDSLQAFDQIIKIQPDLIITDWMMPKLTGIELCNKLKSCEDTLHIPVMMLTALSLLSHEIDSYEKGADAYITKPFNLNLFKTRVDALVQSRMRFKTLFMGDLNIEPTKIAISTYDQILISRCLEIIENKMQDSSFGVDELCDEVAMSRSQLYRKIKSITGFSTVQFIRNIRLKRAAQLLENDNSCVNEVMIKTGITNSSYFSKIFKEEFGCLPKQYKNKSIKNDQWPKYNPK